MVPEILVLRHGETVWNAENRMQGRLDSALTETGHDQARAQNRQLLMTNLSGFRFFSSPLGRAFHTASIALKGVAMRIDTDPRLCEIDVGTWSGKKRSDLALDFHWTDTPDGALEIYEHAPGGEGYDGLRRRCAAFLDELDQPAVIVTHGITSRMLRLLSLGWPTDRIGDLPGGQGVIYRVANGEHSRL